MTDPTPLSRAAQAVLDAAETGLDGYIALLPPTWKSSVAAALRAVADQAEIFFDAYDEPRRVVTVDDLLNIAAELEGVQ